jgi:2-amino-4-hydroxy-6-hydroxymethyldihydropteridine diphosphokinase
VVRGFNNLTDLDKWGCTPGRQALIDVFLYDRCAMTATEKSILIALGSNLSHPTWGAPPAILMAAIEMLAQAGVSTRRCSSIWRSAAWPDPTDPPYANAVIAVATLLPPVDLLAALHRIEAAFGRARGKLNAPRTLDIDLIAYGSLVHDGADGPQLPHPRTQDRAFVLRPLAEVDPAWRHPISGTGIAALLAALPPDQTCVLWGD